MEAALIAGWSIFHNLRAHPARAFFEALVADNIGIGRTAVLSMLFARRVQRNTQSIFRTRIFTEGTQVRLDIVYKHCRVT